MDGKAIDMANSTADQITKLKGTNILVKVEDSLLDVIIVSFKLGIKVFQGALLDVSKKNCPYGIVPPHPNWPHGATQPVVAEKPPETVSDDKFNVIKQRHTYFQQAPDVPAPPPAKKTVSKTARTRDQSVRMRRLRPRQVLCYHCQSFCSENASEKSKDAKDSTAKSAKVNSTSVSSTTASNPKLRPCQQTTAAKPTTRQAVTKVNQTKASAATTSCTTVSAAASSTTLVSNSTTVNETITDSSKVTEDINIKEESSPVKLAKVSLHKLEVENDIKSESASTAETLPVAKPKSDEYQAVSSDEASSRLVLRKRLLSPTPDNKTPARKRRIGVKKKVMAAKPPALKIPMAPPPPSTASTTTTTTSHNEVSSTASISSLKLVSKTSPVIKISFANPQGKESVLKIPPRVQSVVQSDNEEDTPWLSRDMADNNNKATKDASAKAAKKALKRAKKDAHKKIVLNLKSPCNTTPVHSMDCTNVLQPHRSKHHHKHKLKRKRKHKDSPQTDAKSDTNTFSPKYICSSSQGENSENESVSLNSNNKPPLQNNENKCARKKLSISLKRLNARAYTRISPKYVVQDDTVNQGPEISGSSHSGSEGDDVPDFPKHEPLRDMERVKPLMMRISSHNVKKCLLETGREMIIGDIVWGKIQGFPWWPGKVLSLTESQRDNGTSLNQQAHVAWFGSSTSSYMPCNQLTSFVDEFKVRYNKKKRGPYKEAIRQATLEIEAQNGNSKFPFELSCLSS